ncbi:MAG TPA: chromate transporter [Firmicutes bacterium]|jgi:chromate transporter|nr:chromate transporter [Bacillota bacterium]
MNRLRSLIKLFWIFFKVGSFTFGGGLTMLPLIQEEVVEKQKWVSEEEIVDIFAISQSVPGVIAINSSIFIGNKVAKIPGTIAAALGVILPAFLSIILILIALLHFQNNVYVERVLSGIRAASAGLILLSAIKLGKNILKDKLNWIIAIAAFTAICVFNINAAWAVIGGGLVGYFAYLLKRARAQK